MSSQAGAGLEWTCPDCGRDYRIPSGSAPTELCKQCIRRRRKSQSRDKRAKEGATNLPPTPAGAQVFVASEEPTTAPIATPRGSLPPEVEAQIARQEREQLLRDVANISRTMTFFRRLVMGTAVMLVLNFLLMGAALFYSLKTLSDLNGLGVNPAQGGQPGAGGQIGNPFRQLDEIKQNIGKMNDVIRDLQDGH